jgi:hypothetical protein
MALADRLDLDLPGAQPALIEVGPQRLEDEQRLTSVGRALRVGEDDVVRRRLGRHRDEPYCYGAPRCRPDHNLLTVRTVPYRCPR